MPAAARSGVTRILAYRSRISMLWQLFIPFCANWSSSGKQIYFKSRCYCTLQQQKYTRAPAPRAWELARVGCVGRDIPEVKITKCSFMVSAFGWHFGDHSLSDCFGPFAVYLLCHWHIVVLQGLWRMIPCLPAVDVCRWIPLCFIGDGWETDVCILNRCPCIPAADSVNVINECSCVRDACSSREQSEKNILSTTTESTLSPKLCGCTHGMGGSAGWGVLPQRAVMVEM